MPCVSMRPDKEQIQEKLKALAAEISSDLSSLETAESKELLSDFVSDLFIAVTERKRREERRQKQADGIAAARAKGVRFGRTRKPVPDNFDEVHRAWRDREMSLREAADMCGLPQSTFYAMAVRKVQAENVR